MTKGQMYSEFLELAINKYSPLRKRLIALVEGQKVMGGCLFAYESYAHTRILKMSGEGFKRQRKTLCGVQYHSFLEDLNKLEKFVVEQEAATMEDCQRAQVLRKNAAEATR